MNTKSQIETGAGISPRIERVSEIPDNFQLITNSQDIHATLESAGLLSYESETGCLFAEVLDGDYGLIFMCTQSVPWLTARVYQLN